MGDLGLERSNGIFIEKNMCVSGPVQFQPMLFMGQLHIFNQSVLECHIVKAGLRSHIFYCFFFFKFVSPNVNDLRFVL